MLNYTESLRRLIDDVVARVPAFASIDLSRLLVFARVGRTGADGPIATCHCLTLPESEPGYFFWQDLETGQLLRRSVWFVAKTPAVTVGGQAVHYMASFSLPRFCDQRLSLSKRKQARYGVAPDWFAKLDTIVHELYHIDPSGTGLRLMGDGGGCRYHSPGFLDDVADLVRTYLATDPDPELYDFLRYDFTGLRARYGGVAGLMFRTSHPRRYLEALTHQPVEPLLEVVPLSATRQRASYSDADLALRSFSAVGSRRLSGAIPSVSPAAVTRAA